MSGLIVQDETSRGPTETPEATTMHGAARLLLAGALLLTALYVLSNYLQGLVWALVIAVALWPAYQRLRVRVPERMTGTVLPLLFTALIGVVFLLPFAVLAIEVSRDALGVVAYARDIERSGLPVPAFVAHLPFGSAALAEWWTTNLSHAGFAGEIAHRVDTASNRELGRRLGSGALHRLILFGFCLLALFFLFRDGVAIKGQCLVASEKMFGRRGERVGRQMIASVHGTVNGLVLVALGEGVVLGIVYFFTGVPHPVLFGAATAIAATIPFAAAVAVGAAALVLLGQGSVGAAIGVAAAGVVVTFVADHFVRPGLIGGATKLPFIWVLLGILGGVESFGLLGLFVGPAVMAALILLWREYTDADRSTPTSLYLADQR